MGSNYKIKLNHFSLLSGLKYDAGVTEGLTGCCVWFGVQRVFLGSLHSLLHNCVIVVRSSYSLYHLKRISLNRIKIRYQPLNLRDKNLVTQAHLWVLCLYNAFYNDSFALRLHQMHFEHQHKTESYKFFYHCLQLYWD
jgi:hypothetical protein